MLQELIRLSSADAVLLSAYAVRTQLGLTDKELKKYIGNMLDQAGTSWPEGFMR